MRDGNSYKYDDYTFEGIRPDEKVELVVNNHPFVLFGPGLRAILLLAVPVNVFLFYGLSAFFTLSFFISIVAAFTIFGREYYDYTMSIFIVTDRRILYLQQEGFFKREVIETHYEKIQEVSSDSKGFMRTLLDFGDVEISTAGSGEGGEIEIKNIPHPYLVQQEISKRVGE